MTDIKITVDTVYQPQPGKPKGSIKDTSGKYWNVWPRDLGSFFKGGNYVITAFDTYTAQTGKTYYTIKTFQPDGAVNGYGPSATASAPKPMNGGDNERRMDIFICGAFNNMLSNPNVNPGALTMADMVEKLQRLKQAWLAVFGPSPLPMRTPTPARQDPISSGNGDMNDDIPF